MSQAAPESFHTVDPALRALADFLEQRAAEMTQRAERAWESSILLFSLLTPHQRKQIQHLAEDTVAIWAIRLRQDSGYARRVYELGQEWGEQAASWELHVYSFTKALDILAYTVWEYLATYYPMEELTPATVFFLARSRDQVLDDLRVPLLSTYLQKREIELEETQFSLQGELSLPGRSLLLELGNRLQSNLAQLIPNWITRVRQSPDATPAMVELLTRRGEALVSLLLMLLQSPTAETGAASLSTVREIGLESAQAGVTFQEMFHALQQLRPILWDVVYEVYRREQYWHPAEFIEVLARLHLLLDLFSEGIGQAFLRQKEMIIQDQAEELRKRDLNLAREMLESLLPNKKIRLPLTDIGAVWQPSREIGGDFYDVFPVTDDDVIVLIGDISGKGISAALLVSMVKYVIKANAPLHDSPAALLTVANRLFYQDMGPELFVTMFAARYTPATGKLLYTSAGHDPCFLCRGGRQPRIQTLGSQGPALGILPEVRLRDRRIWIQPDDILMLYTDGLVNVRCPGKRPITANRLCTFITKHRHLPAQTMAQSLIHEVTGPCEITDDITLVLAKREGAPAHG